jgi:fatty acid desaturase
LPDSGRRRGTLNSKLDAQDFDVQSQGRQEATKKASFTMLWTIAVILLVLWALGMVSSYTLGGFIHLLLLLAIIVVLIRVIQGRSPVA